MWSSARSIHHELAALAGLVLAGSLVLGAH